jgi:hypothetical protein
MDNPFDIPTSGQGDWDSALQGDFDALERGYHVTELTGMAVSTGQFLSITSGGMFVPYSANSPVSLPSAYAFTAASSGESLTALAWGIVRSLAVNSALIPGKTVYANNSGYAVSSGTQPVGIALDTGGLLVKLPGFNVASLGGGGGGVTQIRSLSDVNPAGLANNSILKWSNASSQFTMQVDSAGGGGTSHGFYGQVPFKQIVSAPAFATKGMLFCPAVNISVTALDALIAPGANSLSYQFSIVECSTPNTAVASIIAQDYVTASPITIVSSLPQRIVDNFSVVSLTAGHFYAFLLTQTNSTTTSSMAIYSNNDADIIHHTYHNIPQTPFINTGAFVDLTLNCTLASVTPPTSGAMALLDNNAYCLGITGNF